MGAISRLIPISCATLLCLGPHTVLADGHESADSGFYIDLGAGGLILSDSDISGGGIDTDAAFDPGYAARSALGYADDNGWRAEVEIAYRQNGVDTIGSSAGSGDAAALSGMVNGYYDFRNDSPLTPYVGAGFGLTQVEADGYSPVSNSSIDDDDLAFSYQAIVGASWAFADALALTADYRYLATDDVSLSTASGTGVDSEYRSHTLFVGLRVSFGGGGDASRMATADTMGQGSGEGMAEATDEATAEDKSMAAAADQAGPTAEESMTGEPAETEPQAAAAEPAAKAAPQLASEYRVLFALDSAALSGAASETLREIAGHAIEGEIIHISAVGHADASGSQAHNMALSKHRAEAVKATLVDFGIPADQIVIDWKGETELLVPTADGVKEPMNRRVEINFPE